MSTTIDKAVMALSGALMTTGIVVLGIVEILAGQPYGAAPVEVTNEAGDVVNTLYPAVDPVIRTGLVLAGIAVLALYGLYKLVEGEPAPATGEYGQTAD